jgi:hypothetical protein
LNFQHPAFAPYQDQITALALDRGFPGLNTLNALADQHHLVNAGNIPLHFTAPDRHLSARDYEHHIHQSGCGPTRIDNWHDVMNALVWLRFPQFKAALNAAHGAAMASETGTLRGRRRDALTVLDESGVWVIVDDASLTTLLAQRQWRALFWEQRAAVLGHMQFVVVGHALLEKMLQPYPALTGKCLLLESPEPILNTVHLNQIQIQATLALDSLNTPHLLVPLPLLGIPGWDESNAHPAYYDNATIFRHPHIPT